MFQRARKRLKRCGISTSLASNTDPGTSGSFTPKLARLTYSPVQEWQTRLFRLHPSTEYDAELEGDLTKVDLILLEGAALQEREQHVTYECLSYSWGQSLFTERLLLNGQVLPISTTLATFLRQYRERKANASEHAPKCDWLWVDQICIDQRSSDEKSIQVSNILTIYSEAVSVIAWLGEAGEHTEYAANRLRSTGLLPETADDQMLDKKVFNGLSELYTRPWVRRIWIRQEIWAATSLSI